jgi:hypothetical protein
LGGNVCTAKKNAEDLVGRSQQIGLKVNYEKTKDMVTSRDQNAGQNHSIKTGNTFFFLKRGAFQIFGNNPYKSKFRT